MGDFRDWLEEEGITGVALTSTGSVEYYDKPWNRSPSEHGIRRMLGIKDPENLSDDEFEDEDEEIQRIANRLKTQFFGGN